MSVNIRYRNWARLGPFDEAGQSALGCKGHLARQHFVKNQTESEDVGTLIELYAQSLLRRHVLHGADERSSLCHPVALQRAGQAEIHHQDSSRTIPHDVLRLEIPVNYPNTVRSVQSLAHLLNNIYRFFWSKLLFFADEGTQVFTLDVLHRDELDALTFAQVIDADHVLVRDLV